MVYSKRTGFKNDTSTANYIEVSLTSTTAESNNTYDTVYDNESASYVATEWQYQGTVYGQSVYALDFITDYCSNYIDKEEEVEKWRLKMKSMISMVNTRHFIHKPMHTKKYARSQKRRRR